MTEGTVVGPDPGRAAATLLEQVLERIDDETGPLASLARAYLRRLPHDESVPADAMYHEVAGLLDLMNHREGPAAVRVVNPTIESHGYETGGTVIEANTDDMPFLVDSVVNEIQAHGLAVARVLHPVVGTERDATGRVVSIRAAAGSARRESVQHHVLDRHLVDADLPHLQQRIEEVLGDVRYAVTDFPDMAGRVDRMAELVHRAKGHFPDVDVDEAVAFLEWLRDDNFVFLGYREYEMQETAEGRAVAIVPGSGLGILADESRSKVASPVALSSLMPELAERYEQGDLLVITKTNRLSTVHRRSKMDYIGVRIMGGDGETVGEARMLGLFTSKAYMERVSRIPVLRQKLAAIVADEDLIEGTHDHKAVVALIEGFPKDELFSLPTEDLHRVVMGLLDLEEQAKVRLFVRRELLDRGVRILVAMPRDRYSAELRRRLQSLFLERFRGSSVDFHLEVGRSEMARVHFTVWIQEGEVPEVSFEELDAEVIELTRSWAERLEEELDSRVGHDEARRLTERWASSLPTYYADSTPLAVAAQDVERLEELQQGGRRLVVGIQNEAEGPDVLTRVALYVADGKRSLSELTPALEDMGMAVIEEVPTRVAGRDGMFIHDFGVLGPGGQRLDLETVGGRVARALEAIWEGVAETDSLNRLILVAGLDHHQVAVLRAYRTYWRRVSPTFTVNYVNDTLVAHPELTAALVDLFELRFDPDGDGAGYDQAREALVRRLDDVPSLDEDRILRGFLRLIEATVRTNVFRPDREAMAFKFRSADVPDMPLPRPHTEVFVMGDEVEGVHLRAGARARGGIRWSERREDYRTEVLGLMKAQVTKNAIIVPTGAKGGFVLRRPPSEPMAVSVRSAYQTFIRGLLDVTDNLVDGVVLHPDRVRVHDGDDPYLVVAADKGTAALSDVANGIAHEYGFWLDDAFASGGSTGYDHKALGVTARGAWKSLERHFLDLGVDPHAQAITVVGIGDMSGDVFGNGMLGSETLRLVAAFDHRHVFLDPDPDPATSFRERQRLFGLPGSSWDDYDRSLLSEGGAIHPRSAKSVELSEQVRGVLGTEATRVTPAELMRIILCAPVDLLWNGGVGTYVKASHETHEAVGDRSNDAVRVDGSDLRFRVVVEGGNLGLTQPGRIEYARAGGHINTDFIDNSGGVNCSDREVNLKILLRLAEQRGMVARDEGVELMARAADDVVERILTDSFRQAGSIGREAQVAPRRLDAYEQLMVGLERRGTLDRAVECLPSTEEMTERARGETGLSRPELAVLCAYAKRDLTEAITGSDLPDDHSTLVDLRAYFPEEVSDRFEDLLWDHPLRRELIATIVANDIVHSQGTTFVSRLVARTGAGAADVMRAYRHARDVVAGDEYVTVVESLFGTTPPDIVNAVMGAHTRLVAALTRWYLRRGVPEGGSAEGREDFRRVEEEMVNWTSLHWQSERSRSLAAMQAAGVPPAVARRAAFARDLVRAPDISDLARLTGRPPAEIGALMHRLGQALGLDVLERILAEMRLADPWQRWALQTIEDDLVASRRSLADRVFAESPDRPGPEAVDRFLQSRGEAVVRLLEMVHGLETVSLSDPAPLMVVVRQVEALAG